VSHTNILGDHRYVSRRACSSGNRGFMQTSDRA
jgi:hypothetical protein